MPLFQFVCPRCGQKREELLRDSSEVLSCEACGAVMVRDYNGQVYGATGKPTKKCSGNCKTCGGCK